MTNLAITPAKVRIVQMWEMLPDSPVNEAISAGMPVRTDSSTGFSTPGNGTTTTEANIRAIACNTADYANATITRMKRGVLDVGNALSALGYGAPVYVSDTDGTLADAAGTVTLIVGYVMPAWGNTTPDKLLLVNL